MSNNNMPPEAIGIVLVLAAVITIPVLVFIFHKPTPRPPPKPIEQIREERKEKANEAGKVLYELGRGMFGLDKSKKPAPAAPVPTPVPTPAAQPLVEPTK